MVDSELNAFLQEREYLFGELRKAHTQIDQLESKLEGMAHHQDLISERGDHTLAYLLNNLIFKHPLPTIMIRRNGMVVKANEAFEKHCVSSDHPIAISIKSIVQTDELPKLVTWLNSISADDMSASMY